MAQLAGSYVFESQENYVEYLVSMGASEENAQKSAQGRPIKIGPIEEDKVTIAFGETRIAFSLNEEGEYSLYEGSPSRKILVTLDGDSIIMKIDSSGDGSLTEERTIKATDTGLIINISNSKGDTAERRYLRVLRRL